MTVATAGAWMAYAVLLGVGALLYAQLSEEGPSFEAISIKAVAPQLGMRGGITGGPGTSNPGRWRSLNTTLAVLTMQAYGLKRYEYGGPGWAEEMRYDVEATMPSNTTAEEFRLMLQKALAERFLLKVHTENRSVSVWRLVVSKNGPNLKLALPSKQVKRERDVESGASGITLDRDGYPILARNQTVVMVNGKARCVLPRISLENFASFLTVQLDRPVIDETNIRGEYSIALTWVDEHRQQAGTDDISGPGLPAAIQRQLGLQLKGAKAPIRILVVDSAERVPIAN